ncbi:MAG: hypothetical protein RLO18_01445, partial [Gimesia chilikensis]
MTLARPLLACCLSLLFLSVSPLPAADQSPERLYDPGVPETGFLTLETDSYTIPMDAASGWTIEKMFYKGYEFSLNNGHYGT